MRTTLTLDDDVAAALQKRRRQHDESFKKLVNEALRAGLLFLESESDSRRRIPATEPVSLGPPRLPNLDDIAEVLATTEGDDFR